MALGLEEGRWNLVGAPRPKRAGANRRFQPSKGRGS
jgi:hypothetical protein